MASKAATSQEVALLMDGPLTDGKFPLPCRSWFTLFPKNIQQRQCARPWTQASAKAPLFGGSPPPASKAALPCSRDCCCFDFSSRTISTISLRAFVIPESSVSGKEAASRMLPLSTHFSPGRRGVSESAMQHDSERWLGSDKQGQFCEPLHAGPAQSHSRSQLCGRPGRLH